MAKVINMRDENFDVYIGRPSRWGNPFIIGDDGDRAHVIKKYEQHLREQLRQGVIKKEELLALEGKRLGCFCKPAACHGDVIVKLIHEFKD